jgi:hypothetical protein
MLHSLIGLSDDDIEIVTTAVKWWCVANNSSLESELGRRALNAAINLIQISSDRHNFAERLACRLDDR